jgi:tetratricopeptide (TPR) repeat protein
MIISSDNPESLSLDDSKIQNLKNLISKDQIFSLIFYSELQCLSHLSFSGLPVSSKPLQIVNYLNELFPSGNARFGASLSNDFIQSFETTNNVAVTLFKQQDLSRNTIEQSLKSNDRILTSIKKVEFASLFRDYETEIQNLLELRKLGENNSQIRQYANALISFRENSYKDTAAAFEKDKLWDDAAKIYRSILLINANDFYANYRMGVISLTLQNINDAYTYLQTAMRLQDNDANVMHQMGVILFTTGKYPQALEYLQKAVALKKNDASTYYYIALCYEELNKFQEAEDNYQQALLKDPTNQDITSSLVRIKQKIAKMKEQWQSPEQKNQTDVEHGEDFPLPINKSAIDIRLKDDAPVDEKPQ